MRIVLGICYRGTGFEGWQSQPSGAGLQDHLERALGAIADEPVRLVAAGRTDAGVHATAQVAHFDTTAMRPDSAWVRGTNAHLDPCIAVQWARPAAEGFHARHSALYRRYHYLLYCHPVRPSLLAGLAGWWHRPLELEPMRAAAAHLLGRHDFSSFRSAECQSRTPVRELHALEISRRGAYFQFELRANAFLHHMVRNILGALVRIGAGLEPPEWMAGLLAARDRRRAPATFAAEGLYLTGVAYPPAHGHFPAGPLPWPWDGSTDAGIDPA